LNLLISPQIPMHLKTIVFQYSSEGLSLSLTDEI